MQRLVRYLLKPYFDLGDLAEDKFNSLLLEAQAWWDEIDE